MFVVSSPEKGRTFTYIRSQTLLLKTVLLSQEVSEHEYLRAEILFKIFLASI
jgi:hypothetical protein